MQRNQDEISAKGIILLFLTVITAISLQKGLVSDTNWYNISIIFLPLLFLGLLIPFKRKM